MVLKAIFFKLFNINSLSLQASLVEIMNQGESQKNLKNTVM